MLIAITEIDSSNSDSKTVLTEELPKKDEATFFFLPLKHK